MNEKKVVIITGAPRGIGREIALAFAGAGYRVAANYIKSREAALSLKAEIEKLGGKCEVYKCDVSDHSEVRILAESVNKDLGGIDTLVNNAAVCRDSLITNMTENEWDDVIKTGLSGPFYMTKECAGLMPAGGAVINIASIAGVRGNYGGGNYAAAKAGLISLTKTAAKEFGAKGITVNAVLPGFHLTDMGKTMPEKYTAKITAESALNRTTDIKELAAFVVFVAGLKSVSGQVFNVDSRVVGSW
jgi:3-oxoacyl-[acyl-carrier protein] reductase